MPVVFELSRPDGSLQLDLTRRMPKYRGAVMTTARVAGSVSDPLITPANCWFDVAFRDENIAAIAAVVTVGNGVISWNAATTACTITWGIF